MESAIFTNMNKLRIVSTAIAAVSLSLLLGLVSMVEEGTYSDESRATDASEFDQTIISISLIPLFVAPAAIAGMAASFFKTVKKQIIIWAMITLVIWVGIMIIALMMLIDPVSFGIPEKYWEQ